MILTLYVILFVIWLQLRHVIKIVAGIENVFNGGNKFFGDLVDTPKECVEQHRKQECLKSVISKGKTYLQGSKQNWT